VHSYRLELSGEYKKLLNVALPVNAVKHVRITYTRARDWVRGTRTLGSWCGETNRCTARCRCHRSTISLVSSRINPRATQPTHSPAVCSNRRIYRPGPQWGLIRAVLIRHGDWVFIKRGLRADSYDMKARVYLFPSQRGTVDIYTVGLSNRDRVREREKMIRRAYRERWKFILRLSILIIGVTLRFFGNVRILEAC